MLSRDQISEFHSEGFLIFRGLCSREYAQNLANLAERCINGSLVPDLGKENKFQVFREYTLNSDEIGHPRLAVHLCHMHSVFRQHSLSPNIVTCVKQLLGGRVCIYSDLFHNKSPMKGHSVELHQDHAYYAGFTESSMVTCWLALDDATTESGCIEYLSNSHLSLLPHTKGTVLDLVLQESLFDPSDFVKAEVHAGDCVFHHSLVVHKSGSNTSPRPRRALATMYLLQSANKDISFCGAYPPFPAEIW